MPMLAPTSVPLCCFSEASRQTFCWANAPVCLGLVHSVALTQCSEGPFALVSPYQEKLVGQKRLPPHTSF